MDNINNLINKIPKLLVPNTLKAVDRLVASVVDIPVAYLEGITQEKRAETEGRIKLTQESTKQIANQMNIPVEYIKNVGQKFAQRVVREQINLDKVTENAVRELEKVNQQEANGKATDPKKTINDD